MKTPCRGCTERKIGCHANCKAFNEWKTQQCEVLKAMYLETLKAATVGKTGIEAVCVANIIKYLWRYEEKNGAEDCLKARWYLDRLIEELK